MDHKRHSGRTTRMLQHANQLAKEGRAVYVVVDPHMVKSIATQGSHSGVSIETLGSLGESFDWTTMRVRGMHPNCVVLVDHHVIEQHFSKILEMWTRYDNPSFSRLQE